MKDLEVKEKLKNFLKNFKEPQSAIRVTDTKTTHMFYILIDEYKSYTDCGVHGRDIKTEHKYNLRYFVPYCREDSDIEHADLSSYVFDKDISFDFEELMDISLLKELHPLLKTVLNYYSNVALSISSLLKEVEFDIGNLQDRLNLGGSLNFISYARDCNEVDKAIDIMKVGLTGYYMALHNAFDIIKKDKEFRFLFMAPFKYLYDVFDMNEDLIYKKYYINSLKELPENPYSYLTLYLSLDDFRYHVDLYKASRDKLAFSKYNNIHGIAVGFVPVDYVVYWAKVGEFKYVEFIRDIINTAVKVMKDRNITNLFDVITPNNYNNETKKAFLLLEVFKGLLANVDTNKFNNDYV